MDMRTRILDLARCRRIDVSLAPPTWLVFAGPTRESISVMVPDCIIPPVSGAVRVDLRHHMHVGLSLGPAVYMTNWSPEASLERALCPASLADTLGLQRRAYWDEVNPLLKQWKNVNNSNCPDCKQFIKVNMGRHIRLDLYVLLEMSGHQLFAMVYLRTQCQGPHRGYTQVPGGSWNLFL